MSCLQNLFHRSRDVRHLVSRFAAMHIVSMRTNARPIFACNVLSAQLHTSSPRYDLMEFFDDPKHWGKDEVRVGRSWTLDELRIKSSSDLHKLWYVLLKERNMLLTMEHECEAEMELFPNPERIDKVEASMKNLETVVRERNRAYHTLETGVDGEQPGYMRENVFGLPEFYNETEHTEPSESKEQITIHACDVTKFLTLYSEQDRNKLRKERNRNRNHVMMLMRRFPNLDREMLKRKYPDVEVDKIDAGDKSRGHFAPKIEK